MMKSWGLKAQAVLIFGAAVVIMSCEASSVNEVTRYASTVQDLQRFAEVTIPTGASNIEIDLERNQDSRSSPIYRARFAVAEAEAREFCSGRNGFGGALVKANGFDVQEKQRFHIQGKSARRLPLTCKAILPSGVQREAIVTFPWGDRDIAIVHFIAFQFPSR